MHCLQITENEGTRNPTWVPEDKLAMVYGRTLWKDFVTFSICQYSILVSTYPAATGGIKTRLCHVGKVYNFCRRSNSKYLAVSPVMDNTEQLRPEAMEDLDIPISQSKTWWWQQGIRSTWSFPRSSERFDKRSKLFWKDRIKLYCFLQMSLNPT